MNKPEFNLLDEPWIKVLTLQGETVEVSLVDALCKAHEFADLRGEMPTQDVAILRLLLAVLHTVFSRQDVNGEMRMIQTHKDALTRWRDLWERNKYPENLIKEYLQKWRERFWLFHDTRPFWQVPEAESGTQYLAAKLNGALSESNNKTRLFAGSSGESKESLSYSEAARWLLYINAFDDTSGKTKGGKLPSPGAGWLGKLGLIFACGNNLFETLMLNLTLLKDGKEVWEEENMPIWELDKVRREERTEIAHPKNQAGLLTLQSRRLLLKRREGKVVGFSLLGGDFFEKEGAFMEQMTVWSESEGKKNEPKVYSPRRHNPARKMWRDFGSVFPSSLEKHKPGVVSWFSAVNSRINLEKNPLASFRIVSIQYGNKDFLVVDAFWDSLSFHSKLMADTASIWRKSIENAIEQCNRLACEVGKFAKALDLAAGGSGKESVLSIAEEDFYNILDQPFRKWIVSIDPSVSDEEREEKCESWLKEAKKLARELGSEMIKKAGISAFVGREIKSKTGKTETAVYYSAPKDFEKFNYYIRMIRG